MTASADHALQILVIDCSWKWTVALDLDDSHLYSATFGHMMEKWLVRPTGFNLQLVIDLVGHGACAHVVHTEGRHRGDNGIDR
jgi:hypothetical protein